MADQLTDNQIEEMREAFSIFDKESSGLISLKDLMPLLKILGHNPTKEEIETYVSMLDDGSGEVDFPEFLSLVAKKQKKSTKNKDELKEALIIFDKDNNGYIFKKELENTLRNFGEKMKEDEIFIMLNSISFDKDDKITHDDLLNNILYPKEKIKNL